MKLQDNSAIANQSCTVAATDTGAFADGFAYLIFPTGALPEKQALAILPKIAGKDGETPQVRDLRIRVDSYHGSKQARRLVSLCQGMAAVGVRLSQLLLTAESAEEEASARLIIDALNDAGLTPEVALIEHERPYFDQDRKVVVFMGDSI